MTNTENTATENNNTINDNAENSENNQVKPISATTMAKKTTLVLLTFFVIFIGILAVVYQSTHQKIIVAEEKAKMKFIYEILPQNLYDNNLSQTMLELFNDNSYNLNLKPLGIKKNKESSKIFFASKNDNLEFIIFEFSATDGYGAMPISLVLATNLEGKIQGVRVVAHGETPGLADYIEVEKSADKSNAWIFQFDNLAINGNDNIWKVKKDGGNLWYKSGATVSARAISKAVKSAMQWFWQNKDALIKIYSENKNKQTTNNKQ